jgi:CheY-like chemotaxis protein
MEPFYTTKEKENGSGLGLSISREIVERHGGEIMVRSKLGEGATFTVVLPDGDRNVGRKDAVDAAPRGTAPARVLVVEDDHAVRAVLQRTLRRHFDVRLARDGAEAIEMLRRDHAFDAVVSDIVMPRVSGLELLHRMSNAWPRLAFRTALITGATMERGDLESLARRGVPVLRKPVDCDQLVAVVASLATGDSAGPQYSAKESS